MNAPSPICRSTTYPDRSGAANVMSFQTTVIERPPPEALTPVTAGAGMATATVPERAALSGGRTALSVVWAVASTEYMPLHPKLRSVAKLAGVRPERPRSRASSTRTEGCPMR